MYKSETTTTTPSCTESRHSWRSGDVDEVGGCDQNPGIFGHSNLGRTGGIEHRQICDHCDVIRATFSTGTHAEILVKREYIVQVRMSEEEEFYASLGEQA